MQFAPFAYLVLYTAYLFIGCFASEELVSLADGFLVASPFATTGMLVLSRVLKLCRWHKVACLIPSASQAETFIDSYFFTFTQGEIVLLNVLLGILSAIFLALANKHFFNDGRKANTFRNARLLQVQG